MLISTARTRFYSQPHQQSQREISATPPMPPARGRTSTMHHSAALRTATRTRMRTQTERARCQTLRPRMTTSDIDIRKHTMRLLGNARRARRRRGETHGHQTSTRDPSDNSGKAEGIAHTPTPQPPKPPDVTGGREDGASHASTHTPALACAAGVTPHRRCPAATATTPACAAGDTPQRRCPAATATKERTLPGGPRLKGGTRQSQEEERGEEERGEERRGETLYREGSSKIVYRRSYKNAHGQTTTFSSRMTKQRNGQRDESETTTRRRGVRLRRQCGRSRRRVVDTAIDADPNEPPEDQSYLQLTNGLADNTRANAGETYSKRRKFHKRTTEKIEQKEHNVQAKEASRRREDETSE